MNKQRRDININNVMSVIGNKNNRDLFNNLLERNLPNDLLSRDYIEPFGGSFGLGTVLYKNGSINNRIYNDLNNYNIPINADIIHHLDYKEIIDKYNNDNSFFYLDPPYINKEKYYEVTFDGIPDHFELSEKIKEIKGKWMLSYQEHPLLKEWYKDYNFDKYDGKSKYYQSEIIIRNYPI